MTTKQERLKKQITNAEKALAHKREVIARHEPGTPWHTRAALEAVGIMIRIDGLKKTLAELEAS